MKEWLIASFVLIPPLIGGILWIGMVSSSASENAARLNRQSEKIQSLESTENARYDRAMTMLIEIRDRTIRIEQWQADH